MLPSLVPLNNGAMMPHIGFGTWRVPARQTRKAVLWAIEAGYRLIDTSLNYRNERQVGQAVRDSGLPRGQLFIATKLENEDHGAGRVHEGFLRSLANLDIGYVDLYLVHWPGSNLRVETWKAMEELLEDPRCRAIGVSNYVVQHLEEVLEHGSVVPAVNQIEVHPFLYPHEVIQLCRENGIQVESYSPLTKGERLQAPVVARIAESHGRSPAQIMIRWHLQHDLIPIPRSVNHAHIEEDIHVYEFTLSDEEMRALDRLNEDIAHGF